jgi:hypothetical protein
MRSRTSARKMSFQLPSGEFAAHRQLSVIATDDDHLLGARGRACEQGRRRAA